MPPPVAPQGQDETLLRMAAAENYNAWLFDRARPYLGRSVLDAGAGIGTFTALAAEGRDRVVAVEPDPDFAQRLEQRFATRPQVEVLRQDAAELEVADAFDSILCLNVLEHISDDEGAIRRFREALAPDGRLLLLVPAHPALYGAADRHVGHERRYRKRRLTRLLERTGFIVEDIRHVNPVGALGWLVSSRVLGRRQIPGGPLAAYDRLVPLMRLLDGLRLPFGLSLWAVGRKPSSPAEPTGSAAREQHDSSRSKKGEDVERVENERG